jgi:GH18 family chitinase
LLYDAIDSSDSPQGTILPISGKFHHGINKEARVAPLFSGLRFQEYGHGANHTTVKTAFIKKINLGGAYVWALNDDDASASLTKTIAAGLK